MKNAADVVTTDLDYICNQLEYELMQLSDKKQIILLEAKSPIKADKCYWFKEPSYLKLLKKHK